MLKIILFKPFLKIFFNSLFSCNHIPIP